MDALLYFRLFWLPHFCFILIIGSLVAQFVTKMHNDDHINNLTLFACLSQFTRKKSARDNRCWIHDPKRYCYSQMINILIYTHFALTHTRNRFIHVTIKQHGKNQLMSNLIFCLDFFFKRLYSRVQRIFNERNL